MKEWSFEATGAKKKPFEPSTYEIPWKMLFEP